MFWIFFSSKKYFPTHSEAESENDGHGQEEHESSEVAVPVFRTIVCDFQLVNVCLLH